MTYFGITIQFGGHLSHDSSCCSLTFSDSITNAHVVPPLSTHSTFVPGLLSASMRATFPGQAETPLISGSWIFISNKRQGVNRRTHYVNGRCFPSFFGVIIDILLYRGTPAEVISVWAYLPGLCEFFVRA